MVSANTNNNDDSQVLTKEQLIELFTSDAYKFINPSILYKAGQNLVIENDLETIKKLLNKLTQKHYLTRALIEYASFLNKFEIFKLISDKYPVECLAFASLHANLGFIESIIDSHDFVKDDYEWAARNAASHVKGQPSLIESRHKIIKIMLDHGATNYDAILAFACRNGHVSIINWMLTFEITNYQMAAEEAAWSEVKVLKQIIDIMISKNNTIDWERILFNAAWSANLNTVKWITENSSGYSFKNALWITKNQEIVEYLESLNPVLQQ